MSIVLEAASAARSLPIGLGDLATWATALGTIAAVVVALALARADGRRRSLAERRNQAELITGWLAGINVPDGAGGMTAPLVLSNASNQLAYRVIVTIVNARQPSWTPPEPWNYRKFLGELAPGRTETTIPHPGGAMGVRSSVELVFQDAAGRYWVRRADGHLSEINQNPAAHYGLPEPVPWEYPMQSSRPTSVG